MRFVEKDITSSSYALTTNVLSKLPKKKYNDKNKVVQKFLLELYSYRCGFCGVAVGREWVGEIEHFYNKDDKRHYDHIKDLKNLHISCKRCNSKKGKIDVETLKIWSPNYLASSPKSSEGSYGWFQIEKENFDKSFKYIGPIISVNQESLAGYSAKKTLEMFDLNGDTSRKYLLELRIRHFDRAKKILDQITALLDAAQSCKGCNKQTDILSPLESIIDSFEHLFFNKSDFAEMIRDNFILNFVVIKACFEKLKERN